MRSWKNWMSPVILLGVISAAAITLTRAQDPAPLPAPKTPAPSPSQAREPSKLTPLRQQMMLPAERAGNWLHRANRADGRFVSSYVPALKTPLEGDYYLRQVGAALALGRVSRFLSKEDYAA